MTQEKLREVLKAHKLWLTSDGKEGELADLSSEDLRGLYLPVQIYAVQTFFGQT